MTVPVYLNDQTVKKQTYNYSTNNASTRTFPTIDVISRLSKNSSFTTSSLTLNPFKSYSGSIIGFRQPIRNKF